MKVNLSTLKMNINPNFRNYKTRQININSKKPLYQIKKWKYNKIMIKRLLR